MSLPLQGWLDRHGRDGHEQCSDSREMQEHHLSLRYPHSVASRG